LPEPWELFRVEGDTIHMNDRISFPLRPMVGVIGVATESETIFNGFAGQHGGNLDNHLHGPGAKVYLPVRQPGGMLAIGDMHASMGDGEVCFTGVEIAGEVTIRGKAGRSERMPLPADVGAAIAQHPFLPAGPRHRRSSAFEPTDRSVARDHAGLSVHGVQPTGTRTASQRVARPSESHSMSAPSIRTSPLAGSRRTGRPVTKRRIAPSGTLPITESCGPVIPASVIAAVPPVRTRASFVCMWVCVPSTAVTRPARW